METSFFCFLRIRSATPMYSHVKEIPSFALYHLSGRSLSDLSCAPFYGGRLPAGKLGMLFFYFMCGESDVFLYVYVKMFIFCFHRKTGHFSASKEKVYKPGLNENKSCMRVDRREFAREFHQLLCPGQTRTKVARELTGESLLESFISSCVLVK